MRLEEQLQAEAILFAPVCGSFNRCESQTVESVQLAQENKFKSGKVN